MTTFVVSLFLPYTVEFETTSSSSIPSTPDTAPTVPTLVRNPASTTAVTQISLFNGPNAPQPPTPAAVADTDVFFSALGAASSTLSQQPAAAVPPHKLVRTDSHAPDWGQARTLNQPKSKPSTAPPSTILAYAKAQEAHVAKALQQLRSTGTATAKPSRKNSQDRSYQENAWDIAPAVQGNGALISVMKAAADRGVLEHVTWCGTLGFPTDSLPKDKKVEIEERLEVDFDAMTVFVDDKDFDGHYNHFCKTILWPIFHYQIPDHPKSKAYADHSWEFYVKTNRQFADRLIKAYKRGDTIWVHDYHLLLVPLMIRQKLPDAKIGFFLHTAFPSSEVFRCLAARKELLEGMLGANIIVFQAEEYANHFLTTCGRLLVVEATEHGVQLEDHFVNVTSIPMGIIPEMVVDAREGEDVKEWIRVLSQRYKDKRLIVARDKLDAIRGVKQKLLAYERFLKNNPEWRENVVLIQVATSSNVDKDLNAQISDIVNRIDSRFSTLAHQPLVFLKQDISNAQYLALLTVADCLLVTPLRDGMNLNSHEYVICQDGKGTLDTFPHKKHGPLILSEFTGSAQVFGSSILSVNPWDYAQCAKAMKDALEMGDAEKDTRYEAMLDTVLKHNGERWTKRLETCLNTAYDSQQQQDAMSVPRLSVNTLAAQYKNSSRRLFILDYEGTLTAWESTKRTTLGQTQRVIDTIIGLLTASDSNIVYIASGRTTEEMEKLFRAIPSVGLIAENGCFLRPFSTAFEAEPWIDLADSVNTTSWKQGVLNMMKYYVERIEGTWIEERACSLTFSYADVNKDEMEAAARQAGDFATHVNESFSSVRVKAVPVDHGIIVEHSGHSKMTASARILEIEKSRLSGSPSQRASTQASSKEIREANGLKLPTAAIPGGYAESSVAQSRGKNGEYEDDADRTPPNGRPDSAISGVNYFGEEGAPELTQSRSSRSASGPDFLMVAGDNREDEPVFHWANELAHEGCIKTVVSVCVGKRPTTEARFTVTQGVPGLLTALSKLSNM